jgi:Zn finger protein HypA/HybF involved in hydrogenase expression
MALIDLNERDVDKWTLRLVVERGTLVFECRNCRHLSEIDVLEMIARFGTDVQVSSVRARMVCRQCHKRRVRSLVKLKVGRKDLAWVPVPPRAGR